MELTQNLRRVQERIAAACARAGRLPSEVTLVAVSKGHPPEAVDAMREAGQRFFGENKVQEAKAKVPRVGGGVCWHMIGHLQTNKCRDAVQLFEVIESVDSLRLGRELDRWADRAGRRLGILLEVNVAGEASKFGYAPEQLIEEIVAFRSLVRLEVQGLMTMAPWKPDPEEARPVFQRLAQLKAECEVRLDAPLPHLSMGMSGDFEVAIEEGATLVRIGTALFGERAPAPGAR